MKEETKWRCLQDLTMANGEIVFVNRKEYPEIMFAEELELINENGEDHTITLWKEYFEKVKPIKFEDLEEGQHLWVMSLDKLLMVAKEDGAYQVCGAWECGINKDHAKIIELVDKPKGHETTPMYYF